jgi:molybdopterin-guanine dinucleotide biosynthesis protein A
LTLLGVVLAGGRSVRFGSDKAMAELHGRTLLSHAIEILGTVCDDVVIAGHDRGIPGRTTVPDMPRGDLGPLGGLCGALLHAERGGYAALLSIGCDTPRLDRAVIGRLLAMNGPAYLADAPIIGHWPVALARPLLAHLEDGGDRSIRRWADTQGAHIIRADVAIPNLNRPEDLDALRTSERD